MQLVVNAEKTGKALEPIELADEYFACELNTPLIHQVVTAYLAGARSGTKAQKNRSAVSGGGAKPWRQKGTGRARAGTSRSPIWRSGGVTFAATPRDHSQKVNRKMFRNALRSIFSELIRQERFKVIDSLTLSQIKTKELAGKLKQLNLDKVLIIADKAEKDSEQLFLSARNLSHVAVCDVAQLSPVNLVGYENVLLTVATLEKLKEKLK